MLPPDTKLPKMVIIMCTDCRAIAAVANNNGKSPKVGIFGNLWEASFADFGKFYESPELERKIWQCIKIAKNGKTCWAKLPFLATFGDT